MYQNNKNVRQAGSNTTSGHYRTNVMSSWKSLIQQARSSQKYFRGSNWCCGSQQLFLMRLVVVQPQSC